MSTNGNKKTDNRLRYYALLRVGKATLHMSEDDYRSFLMNHGAGFAPTALDEQKISATTMSIGQLSQAVEDMKRLGFRPKRKNTVSKLSEWRKPRIAKICACWIALFEAGVVSDRSEKSMTKWCATITHKPRLEWASSEDLNKCIEGLKSWARRERVPLQLEKGGK